MITLHVIGDNVAIHYGPYLRQYISPWCRYSKKGYRIGKIVNPEGPNGQDSMTVLTYVNNCISQHRRWDVVLVNCGLWDIRNYQGVYRTDIDKYATNLEIIFELLEHITERVIWVRTTPVRDELHNSIKREYQRFNSDVIRYNLVADKVAARRRISVIDLYNFSQSIETEDMYCDHVHFSDGVRSLQGAFIAGQIVAYISSGPRCT